MARRWLLGLAGAVLALIILVWGGRALLQRAKDLAPAPAPAPVTAPAPSPAAPKKVNLPQTGGPPLNAATAPAPPSRPSQVPTKAAAPAPPKAEKAPAPASKDRYQLLVISYNTYDQARALKKRIQAKDIPAKVYRVKANKKTYYTVKAGPFTSKQQAEKAARRLKSEMRLAQAPKVIQLKEATLKTSSRKPTR